MFTRFAALSAFVVLAFGATAQAQTLEQQAAIERASATGWELYQHDQAAWVGTDAMRADVADPEGEGIRGWITQATPEGGVVLFFVRAEGEQLFAAYRALYRDGQLREHGRVNERLTDEQVRLFQARQIASAASIGRCAQAYNSVTLPRAVTGPDGADVDVYLMPASTSDGEVPFGGHFRLAVDSSAGVVRETQRFTNSCLTMQLSAETAALTVSQMIGELPTEVHVFESLTWRIPVFVATRSGVWAVEGRAIRLVPPNVPSASAPPT